MLAAAVVNPFEETPNLENSYLRKGTVPAVPGRELLKTHSPDNIGQSRRHLRQRILRKMS